MLTFPRLLESFASPRALGKWKAWILAGLAIVASASSALAQRDDYSGPPIDYFTAEVDDPVAQLARQIANGQAELAYRDATGYLSAVLAELDISANSQVLVFSKTSLQRHRISPHRPRAIYFNDNVYVGYCQQGEVLELAATDAQQGAIFYTLSQSRADRPELVRDQGQCLACHASQRTQDVPGYLVRSVFANASGMPEFGSGSFTTSHSSPFEQRWGGWYVTGAHGAMRHMGNAIYDKRVGELDRQKHANLTALDDLVDTAPYPGDHSDIVALMVLEHQTQMHNAIAWANYESRRAIHQSETMNQALGRPPGFLSDSSRRRIERAADRVLEYLLFVDEFALAAPVQGTGGFAAEFAARGPRDPQGRSLRELDMQTRMFRYPCSYLIYSEAFDGLPDPVRTCVLEKLRQILDGSAAPDEAKRYRHLTATDRKNLREILLATHTEYAAVVRGL